LDGLFSNSSRSRPIVPSRSYALQISTILQHAYRQLGETPVVLGETGVPFDLNDKMAFETGDFAWQERMLDGICAAIGEAGLSNFKCV